MESRSGSRCADCLFCLSYVDWIFPYFLETSDRRGVGAPRGREILVVFGASSLILVEGPDPGLYDRVLGVYDRVCLSVQGFRQFGLVLPWPCERNLQECRLTSIRKKKQSNG